MFAITSHSGHARHLVHGAPAQNGAWGKPVRTLCGRLLVPEHIFDESMSFSDLCHACAAYLRHHPHDGGDRPIVLP